MQKISRNVTSAVCLMLAALLSSCAGTQTADPLLDSSISEAALLDESEHATPVVDDAAVFADLNAAAPDAASKMALSQASSSDSPFYNPIGGESLGRVAYTLYGSQGLRASLLEQNPDLRGVKALSAEQRVYFDFSRVKPVPTFLTKDLLDRYASELAAKISTANLAKETVQLAPGETLQQLSQRLYGTTRYWTEIYLLNQDSIKNYDQVMAGASLSVYQRSGAAVGATQNSQEPAPPAVQPELTSQQEAAQPVIPAQPEALPTQEEVPTPAPVEMASPDPIPETPVSQAPRAAEPSPPSAVQEEAPQEIVAKDPINSSFFGNSANIRRMLYVGLILVIGALAFFFTRNTRTKSFDMLDVTTNDTASSRPKLTPKDSQHQDIG